MILTKRIVEENTPPGRERDEIPRCICLKAAEGQVPCIGAAGPCGLSVPRPSSQLGRNSQGLRPNVGIGYEYTPA